LFGADEAMQNKLVMTTKRQIKERLEQSYPGCINFLFDEPLSSAVPTSPHGYNKASQTQDGNFNLAYTSQGGERNDSKISQNSTTQAAT
jgi:hypothetical protein